jgi:heat shock protein HslJ
MKPTSMLAAALTLYWFTVFGCAQIPRDNSSEPSELIEVTWKWVAYKTAISDTLGRDIDSSNYLYFPSDSAFSGYSGCNGFGGACELTSSVIKIKGGIHSTLIGCPQIKDYVRSLHGEVPYSLEDSVSLANGEEARGELIERSFISAIGMIRAIKVCRCARN